MPKQFEITCKQCSEKSVAQAVPLGKPFICPRCGNLDRHDVKLVEVNPEPLAMYLDKNDNSKRGN